MNTKKLIRVILADDHAIIRRGIRRILEQDTNICVIGESSTGAGAILLVNELQPDILVLDIEMPDMNGYHVARQLRAGLVKVRIIALSTCDENYFIQEIIQMGMDAYINKSDAPAKIHQAIYELSDRHSSLEINTN
jgi:two-component system, NarL family, response regulator NreC